MADLLILIAVASAFGALFTSYGRDGLRALAELFAWS